MAVLYGAASGVGVAEAMSECGHIPTDDFKSGAQWICSGCGKVSKWTDEWEWIGQIGCRKCGQEPVVTFVACSEACRKKHAEGKQAISRTLIAKSVDDIDGQIARLQAQRSAAVKKLEAKP